jgi:hypothetical protein
LSAQNTRPPRLAASFSSDQTFGVAFWRLADAPVSDSRGSFRGKADIPNLMASLPLNPLSCPAPTSRGPLTQRMCVDVSHADRWQAAVSSFHAEKLWFLRIGGIEYREADDPKSSRPRRPTRVRAVPKSQRRSRPLQAPQAEARINAATGAAVPGRLAGR